MTKTHALVIVLCLCGSSRNSRAQDGSFIPPPINPLKKTAKKPPPRANAGSPAAASAKKPTAKSAGAPTSKGANELAVKRPDGPGAAEAKGAGSGSGKPAAAPIKGVQEVFLPRLSDAELRSWLKTHIKRAATSAWNSRFRKKHKRRPVIKVAAFINRTAGPINTALIQQEANAQVRASKTLALASRTRAADLLLLGQLHSQDQAYKKQKLMSTLCALSLVHLETGQKVWMELFRSRKLVELTRAGPRVTRVGDSEIIDLVVAFNDSDALLSARQLIRSLRESSWLKSPSSKAIRLYPLHNRTSEVINGSFISLALEQALISIPRVEVLGRRDEMDVVHAELAQQVAAGFTPSMGQELGSTHVLNGWITSDGGQLASESIHRYQVTMEAIDVETNQKVWMKVHIIKKVEAVQP